MATNLTTVTPRNRQEQDPHRLLRQRRPIPVMAGPEALSPLVSARADADFLIEVLWAANTAATSSSYTMHIVPSGGVATTANCIAFEVPTNTNATSRVIAATGLLLSPGDSLVVKSGGAGTVNFYGYGYDILGDIQS